MRVSSQQYLLYKRIYAKFDRRLVEINELDFVLKATWKNKDVDNDDSLLLHGQFEWLHATVTSDNPKQVVWEDWGNEKHL